MFNWQVFWHFLFQDPNMFFLQGAWTTLWISVVAQALGVVIGLFLALMYMSRFPVIRGIAGVYIWFFRGSPLLVQILLLWDGLPRLTHILLSATACILVSFSLNEGAYMAEIIRAAIGSVDPGQMEAAKALGMRYPLAMRRIVLPQAARVIIPPLGNEFNNMLKTTSLGSVIGLYDLTGTAEIYGSQQFVIFELLIVATVYYLILTTLWTFAQRWIEHRLDPDRIQVDTKLVEEKSLAQRLVGIGSARR